MKKYIGVLLLLSPFIAVTVYTIITVGWLNMLLIFGLTAITVVFVVLGILLLFS